MKEYLDLNGERFEVLNHKKWGGFPMKGHFSKSIEQLKKDFSRYQHYCNNICKGDNPINNTYCKKCEQYISKHNMKG